MKSIGESLEEQGIVRHMRIVVKKGPMQKLKFDGEARKTNRQTYLVIDGMHRITYLKNVKGVIKGEQVASYPADVYSEDLPVKLMVSFAAGDTS